MDNTRLDEILSCANEFSLLYNYKNVSLAELDSAVGSNVACLKDYLHTDAGRDDFKADQFADFLKEFKFYLQGKGTTFPANFDMIDYRSHITQKLLSEEMCKVYREIVSNASEK